MPTQHLLLTDVDAIQRYVFDSVRMATIVGASGIVAAFDDFAEREATECFNAEYAVLSGGNGLFVFSDPGQATMFGTKMQTEFCLQSGSGSMTVSEPVEFDAKIGFTSALKAAFDSLESKKRSGSDIQEPLAMGLARHCVYCGTEAALPDPVKLTDDTRDIGSNCRLKLRKRHQLKLDRCNERANNWASDFNELAGDDYLALLVIDGDGLGARLKTLTSPSEYRAFSDNVKRVLASALAAGQGVCIPGNSPFQVLYAGGDDVVIACPAQWALPFAEAFSRSLCDENWSWAGKSEQIGFSMGISITHSKFPFRASHQIANQLLRSSKTMASGKWPEGAVDFAIVTEAAGDAQTLLDDREIGSENSKVFLTGKPYRLRSSEYNSLGKLRDACQVLQGFPTNRLVTLRNQLSSVNWNAVRSSQGSVLLDSVKQSIAQHLAYVESRVAREDELQRAWKTACESLPISSNVFPYADLADAIYLWGTKHGD